MLLVVKLGLKNEIETRGFQNAGFLKKEQVLEGKFTGLYKWLKSFLLCIILKTSELIGKKK